MWPVPICSPMTHDPHPLTHSELWTEWNRPNQNQTLLWNVTNAQISSVSPIRRRRRQVGGKIRGKYFSGNYHVKFGHFVNFSHIYFRTKMSCPQSWLSCYACGPFAQISSHLDDQAPLDIASVESDRVDGIGGEAGGGGYEYIELSDRNSQTVRTWGEGWGGEA